jgi:dephospho-CoA kinase
VVFGLLGGVAAGKSTVADLVAGPSGKVISADHLAHEVLAEPEMIARIAEAFGPEMLDSNGQVNRSALGKVIFQDQGAREQLEGWTHPAIRARISSDLKRARARGVPHIVLDVPLLLENDAEHGLAAACDHLIFLEVPDEERDRRAQRDRGWAPGEVARREATQLPLSAKQAAAHWTLRADGTLSELNENVQTLLTTIARLSHPKAP